MVGDHHLKPDLNKINVSIFQLFEAENCFSILCTPPSTAGKRKAHKEPDPPLLLAPLAPHCRRISRTGRKRVARCCSKGHTRHHPLHRFRTICLIPSTRTIRGKRRSSNHPQSVPRASHTVKHNAEVFCDQRSVRVVIISIFFGSQMLHSPAQNGEQHKRGVQDKRCEWS